jgi:hypothetical protein
VSEREIICFEKRILMDFEFGELCMDFKNESQRVRENITSSKRFLFKTKIVDRNSRTVHYTPLIEYEGIFEQTYLAMYKTVQNIREMYIIWNILKNNSLIYSLILF